jgi:L-aspartate oxidase
VELRADFVVVGAGIAGLRALASLVGRGDILLLTKAGPAESNTGYAQGGIAAAVGPDDSPELHLADTLAAGAGLCDEAAVNLLVHEGPRYVRELVDWGVPFDRDPDGAPALAREGAHSVRRVLHARDVTGREIARTLWSRSGSAAGVRVLHDALATTIDLVGGECRGVRFVCRDGRTGLAHARAVLLATGGAGRVFRETTNPAVATGDGLAMAYRCGVQVSDLEFVQFHPTVLSAPGAARFLLSEALRGEGARLVNAEGEAFMTRYDPAGDLAPRDVVAAAMVREQMRTGRAVYLSLAHLEADRVRMRFPMIAQVCANAGLDLATDALPVSPAAHYMCGGVDTDLDGRTSIPGLFAAGEVACTGVHGANRLASNSLLEGLVFGARAADAMWAPAAPVRLRPVTLAAPEAQNTAAGSAAALACTLAGGVAGDVASDAAADVPSAMWAGAGLVRDAAGLRRTLDIVGAASWRLEPALAKASTRTAWEEASVALVGWLITRAALRREESRGGHRRADFPARDDLHWQRHVADRRVLLKDIDEQEA